MNPIFKDRNGNALIIGKQYGIPNSLNTFICVSNKDLNEIMFVREHDNQKHFGREFVEFKNGQQYLNVELTPLQ